MNEIHVVESVLKANDEVAGLNRKRLAESATFTIDLIGSPGCGKTTLLEQTLQQAKDRLRVGVAVGDLATTRDAERLLQWAAPIVQINTGRGCHLEAHQVRQALDRLDLASLDVLVIENVGNLICPVGFDLGQDVKVGMFSVTEGDDKPAKHPHLVVAADLLVLNKIDLLDAVRFDRSRFLEDVERLHPGVPVMELAAESGGIQPWLTWIEDKVSARRTSLSG